MINLAMLPSQHTEGVGCTCCNEPAPICSLIRVDGDDGVEKLCAVCTAHMVRRNHNNASWKMPGTFALVQ